MTAYSFDMPRASIIHLHLRSRCGRCGATAWTRTTRDRVWFLNRHVHEATPWAPDLREPAPSRVHHGWPDRVTAAAILVVAVMVMVLS